MPDEKKPLAADDQQIVQLREAAGAHPRVRIEHLASVAADDPALPAELRKRGIPTTTEGYVVDISDSAVMITMQTDKDTPESARILQKAIIPLDKILSVTLLGPVEVSAETIARETGG